MYEAVDLRMGEDRVALKEMRGLGEGEKERAEARKKIIDEAKMQRGLAHDHIIRLFTAEVDDYGGGQFDIYLVIEYAGGGTLKTKLLEKKNAGEKFGEEEAVRIMLEVLSGLEYIHKQNIVHRDLKPDNILFKDGRAKISDFGLARMLEGSASAGSTGAGTPPYMSPESYSGGVDRRSDIYSAGITLYELLSGSPPFTGTPEEIQDAHRSAVPARISGVSDKIWDLIAKALAKKKEERYQNAGEMKNALAERLREKEKVFVCVRCGRLPDGSAFDPRNHEAAGEVICKSCAGRIREPEPKRSEPVSTPAPRIVIPKPSEKVDGIGKEPWMHETRVNEFGRSEARWGPGEHDWLVLIPSGEFMMGAVSPDDAMDNEKPQHKVMITKPFWLMKYPVTQEQYQRVIGKNPSHFKGDGNRPVENVSWNYAQDFIRKINKGRGLSFRLATEAEWEYAERGGTTTKYYWGNNMDGEYAWYSGNSNGRTHPVGKKKANGYGLYDMAGNVWEWVSDWYNEKYYSTSPVEDPKGQGSEEEFHVLRGGSWYDDEWVMRVSYRIRGNPSNWSPHLGFRCAQDF